MKSKWNRGYSSNKSSHLVANERQSRLIYIEGPKMRSPLNNILLYVCFLHVPNSCHLTKYKDIATNSIHSKRGTKKMSYFNGCHSSTLVMILITFFFLFFCMVKGDKPLYEMSTREELVQLAGYGEVKLSTVLVTGTVLCEACLTSPQSRASPIPGALVTINCPTNNNMGRTRRHIHRANAVTSTDEYGDFSIDLPSHLHSIPNLESVCCVDVLRVPRHSGCRPSFVNKHKKLTLTSSEDGIRYYSAGNISLLHSTSKPSSACSKRWSSNKHAW